MAGIESLEAFDGALGCADVAKRSSYKAMFLICLVGADSDVLVVLDAELKVGIYDRSGSMGVAPNLVFDGRAMRGKENNENTKHHDDERGRPMNDNKGG